MPLKTIILSFILCTLAFTGFGQELKSVETKIVKPHDDVRIEYQVLRENQVKHGFYNYYHRNILIVKGRYVGGKKHGKWKRFYQDGGLFIDAFYLQDLKHGQWKYFHATGSTLAEISFNRGQKTGVWKSYYFDGFISSTYTQQTDSNLAQHEIYYPNKRTKSGASKPQIQIMAKFDEQNDRVPVKYEKYYPNGKLYERSSQLDRTKVGMYESFYFTGIPWKKMKYESSGRLFSIYEYNNPVSRDAERGSFRDGEGVLNDYNDDGTLFSAINYSKGFPDGKVTYYEEGDKEIITGFKDDNEETGTWRVYKPVISKAELIAEFNFVGIDTAHALQYMSDFDARIEGMKINKRKFGMWKEYNAVNELTKKTNFYNGLEHGRFTRYRLGNLREKGHYFYDVKVGKWETYNDNIKVSYTELFGIDVYADTAYLHSDSCGIHHAEKETAFYNVPDHLTKNEKRWTYITVKDKYMNFGGPLMRGKFGNYPVRWQWLQPEVKEYKEQFKVYFPQFIPWQVEVRNDVVKDIDEGLFIETLDPKKLKVKGDKQSPKLGVAMIVLEVDEFGFIQKSRLVRGVHPEWDDKIMGLFDHYNFWDPGTFNYLPIACALQIKLPVELELVKRMD